MTKKTNVLVVVLLLLAWGGVSPKAQDSIPQPILDAWEEHWNQTTKEVVERMQQELLAEGSSIETLKDEIFTRISWEELGRRRVEALLLQSCGSDVLAQILPFYVGEAAWEDIGEDLKTSYFSCQATVDLMVNSAPVYAIIELVYEKNQSGPN